MDILLIIITLIITIQSFYSLYLLIYSWNDENTLSYISPPLVNEKPKKTFSIILPAYEEEFIADTIISLARFDYPQELFEILIALRAEDSKTINITKQTISVLNSKGYNNLKIVLVHDPIRNKPTQLNEALTIAKNEVVAVFDAEDEPKLNLLLITNTLMLREKLDVVQFPVQLININSKWFSLLNAMEYYFWFRSSLPAFASKGLLPLAGNSLFINSTLLKENNGWDQNCLTEDAELGLRLSVQNARFKVVYDPLIATHEETPLSVDSFIAQRTRWNQGFIQILLGFKWLKLDSITKKLNFIYILIWPILQINIFIILLFLLLFFTNLKVNIIVSIFSIIPLFILSIQLIVVNIGIYKFHEEFRLKYSVLYILKSLITFFPYQLILLYSSFVSIIKFISKNNKWNKTKHNNAHRNINLYNN